jgi:putative resolvase
MKAKEVLKILNITRGTLYNYVKDGKIKGTLLDNGYYDYDENSVFAMLKKDDRTNVIYARVSGYKQKNDLNTQIKNIQKYCKINNITVDKIYSDISSGIDLDRTSFNHLIDDVISLKIKTVYISNRDRLTRLSFKTLNYIFSKFHTNIVVINDNPDKTNDVEIFEELISILHIFSSSMYSNRRKNKIKIINDDIQNFISNDDT